MGLSSFYGYFLALHFSALAFPPFKPPRRPKAPTAGFFWKGFSCSLFASGDSAGAEESFIASATENERGYYILPLLL